jgi:transposase, IS5 family
MKRTLFAEEARLEELSKKDPLVRIKALTDWKLFERELEKMFPTIAYPKGGRPPFNKLLLFKIVILQEYYGLSDHGIEYQINDRLSFMRFLDFTLDDKVPDQNTIWNFKESLKEGDRSKRLFDIFLNNLRKHELILNKGSIIDASIVKAPVQRNSKEENDQIKNGETPDWEEKKKAHKDVDASWTSKHGKNYYGYKNHIKIDQASKFITACEVTTASVHDSQAVFDLIDKHDKGHTLYADSAYHSKDIRDMLSCFGIKGRIHKKGARNKPLSEKDQKRNHQLSKKRCRIEHVFGFMRKRFKEVCVRAIGFERAQRDIQMKNLVYNIHRYAFMMG